MAHIAAALDGVERIEKLLEIGEISIARSDHTI